MMAKRSLALIFILFFALNLTVFSQAVRDYAITDIRYEIENETILKIIVVVENRGTDATSSTNVIVTNLSDANTVLRTDPLSPLEADSSVTLEIPLNLSLLPAGTEQNLQVSIGVDEFELANTPIAEDNSRSILVAIPERDSVLSEFVFFSYEGETFIILDEEYSRNDVFLALAAAFGSLILLWLLSLIIRLIFRRAPRFGTWQPPYGLMPMYDQNTLEGRRWAWQQHAQNSLLLAPPTEGNIHAIKLLAGADSQSLNNWKISGMRLSQYDSYGRIARSQFIVDKKYLRQLNNILKKRRTFTEAKLQKALRPIADTLAKGFYKKISQRNAFLPVSFDIRWEGRHGEVRIFFELYQCIQNAWYRIDQWEPMMQVISQTMQENFTFTIHGKTTPEKMKEYRERLRDDIIWLLLETCRVEQAQVYNPQEQQTPRQQFDVPDTLSGMEPLLQAQETANNSA